MNNHLDVNADELKLLKQILEQCIPGIKVKAFGSRANNTAKPYSDLDLAVMTETPLTLYQGAMLTEAFEESNLPFKVDVVDWASISSNFKEIIRSSLIDIE